VPLVEGTAGMLRAVCERFEAHHGVRIADSAVEAAARLSERYISGRQLPDKAVDLLDTSSARVALGLASKPSALDDLEHRLADPDTAVRALEADALQALQDRDAELVALRRERDEVETQRQQLEQRWARESELARRLQELQKRLVPAPDAPATEDPARLREEVEKLAAELVGVQGESPLVATHVTPVIVSQVVSAWTGIPVGKMLRDDVQNVLQLEDRLRERVVGQDPALATLARKIRASRAGLQSPTQPIGVFLLVGPSGVGKTETALAVADLLFGGERFMITVNMSEFLEKHSVSRLIGSPPGYVGYGEGGILTEAVRQRPYSVVLLDEVEKADPEVLNLFYQVFDKGTLADGEGREVDFRNTVLLMGSNLGSELVMDVLDDDEPPSADALVARLRPTLQKHFKPALLGRMTIVPYVPLSTEILRVIAELKLERVGERLAAAHGIRLEVLPAAKTALAERCTDPESGARSLDRIIDQSILPRISLALLERMAAGTAARRLTLGVDDANDFSFAFEEA